MLIKKEKRKNSLDDAQRRMSAPKGFFSAASTEALDDSDTSFASRPLDEPQVTYKMRKNCSLPFGDLSTMSTA